MAAARSPELHATPPETINEHAPLFKRVRGAVTVQLLALDSSEVDTVVSDWFAAVTLRAAFPLSKS